MSTRPFPDFRRDGGLSASELNRLQSEVERLTNLRAEAPLELADTATGPLLRWNGPDIFLARLTGVFTPTGGAQAGINLYSFIEQIYDAASGIPKDATPGRRTYPAAPTQPVNGYALEVKNATLTVPGTTPPGYTNAGPYVEMCLKGFVLGAPVYEFDGGSGGGTTLTAVVVQNVSPLTVNVGSGTIVAYAGKIANFNSATGTWTITATSAYWYPINGETPLVNYIYEGVSFGNDNVGTAIYGSDIAGLSTGNAVLAADFDVAAIGGTWTNVTGLSFSIPANGNYLIIAQVSMQLSSGASVPQNYHGRLIDNTTSILLGSVGCVASNPEPNQAAYGTLTLVFPFLGALKNHLIQVQVHSGGVGGPSIATILATDTGAYPASRIDWVKIN